MLSQFNPSEFFAAADYLKEKKSLGDDAFLRSSISRYYYAAFICARDKFSIKTKGPSGHKSVLEFYEKHIDENTEQGSLFMTVHDNLQTLKGLREKADYEPHNACKTKECTRSRALSEQVLDSLDQIKN